VVEPQALKGTIGQHLNLQAKWQNKKFKVLVDSRVIRNYMSPAAVKRMGLLYRDKKDLYLLVIISGDPIIYRDGIIQMEIGPVNVEIKG